MAFLLLGWLFAAVQAEDQCDSPSEVCLLQLKQTAARSSTRWTSFEGDDLDAASAVGATGSSATLINQKDAAIFADLKHSSVAAEEDSKPCDFESGSMESGGLTFTQDAGGTLGAQPVTYQAARDSRNSAGGTAKSHSGIGRRGGCGDGGGVVVVAAGGER